MRKIETNLKVNVGKPTIKGTRITVEFVLGLLKSDWTTDQIIKDYPTLTKEDILACIGYAQDIVKEWKIYPASV